MAKLRKGRVGISQVRVSLIGLLQITTSVLPKDASIPQISITPREAIPPKNEGNRLKNVRDPPINGKGHPNIEEKHWKSEERPPISEKRPPKSEESHPKDAGIPPKSENLPERDPDKP